MRKKLLVSLLLLACLFLGACAAEKIEIIEEPKPGEITIYYLNTNDYKLVPYNVVVDDESLELKVLKVIDYLHNAPEGYKNVFSEKTTFLNHTISEEGIVNMYFSADYSSVAAVREIMCRTAVVKSLSAIEGVAGVSYYVADQPLMDSTGVEIGIMNADSFEDTLFQKISEVDIVLYFADETGKALVTENRTIKYAVDEGEIYYVVKALIDGPDTVGHFPVLTPNVMLTDATIKDGVCYLYFDQSFLNIALDVANNIPIYALVNTVSEIAGVNRVQFVVNGSSDVLFRNEISLAQTFSANLDIIRKDK